MWFCGKVHAGKKLTVDSGYVLVTFDSTSSPFESLVTAPAMAGKSSVVLDELVTVDLVRLLLPADKSVDDLDLHDLEEQAHAFVDNGITFPSMKLVGKGVVVKESAARSSTGVENHQFTIAFPMDEMRPLFMQPIGYFAAEKSMTLVILKSQAELVLDDKPKRGPGRPKKDQTPATSEQEN